MGEPGGESPDRSQSIGRTELFLQHAHASQVLETQHRADGSVQRVCAQAIGGSRSPTLLEEAIRVVKSSRYEPARVDGTPVESVLRHTIVF